MAITISVQPESGQTEMYPICFSSSKESPCHIVQNLPRSDLDCLVRSWPNPSGLDARQSPGIIGPSSGRMQLAHYQFPIVTQLHSSTDVPNQTVLNQPRSYLVSADCIRLWPNGSSLGASQCARIIRPTSGQHFWADPDQIRTGSGMFTEGF